MLELGPLPEIKILSKAELTAPDISFFNEDQQQGFDFLYDFINKDIKCCGLHGKAGTGKTTLISTFIQHYVFNNKVRIAVCAPTNKAVKVLAQKCQFRSPRVEFMTVHKLIGLREYVEPDGRLVFKKSPRETNRADEFDLVIIDECSMINTMLFDFILQDIGRFILVGDSTQINPVGEVISPCFEMSMPRFDLMEIVRQGADSPIIKVSQNLELLFHTSLHEGYGCYAFNDTSYWDVVDHYFGSEHFNIDSDFCKIIAWRNKTVNSANNYIRDLLFGRELPRVVVGERMLANKPIIENDMIVFNTNDEFQVESYTIEVENIGSPSDPIEMTYYKCRVLYYDYQNYKSYHMIRVLHEDSVGDFTKILDQVKELALSANKSEVKSKLWQQYYKLVERYARVNYSYSITCHKSQGSTYRSSFVLANDIRCNPGFTERTRLLYTAVTRASHNLFVMN